VHISTSSSFHYPHRLWYCSDATHRLLLGLVVSNSFIVLLAIYRLITSIHPPIQRLLVLGQITISHPLDSMTGLLYSAAPRMTSMDLRVGGKYRIGKKIGSGSFGKLLVEKNVGHQLTRQVTSTSASTSSRARRLPSS
jgi:hypothetical protein